MARLGAPFPRNRSHDRATGSRQQIGEPLFGGGGAGEKGTRKGRLEPPGDLSPNCDGEGLCTYARRLKRRIVFVEFIPEPEMRVV